MTVQTKRAIPLLDLQAQYAGIRDEVRKAIDEVCESQHFVMGPNVTALEEEIAAYSQCRFGIGVSSGTDALLVALMGLDIGADDAVLTTPYSFFATAGTIARVGATPVFCDIDAQTFNLDPSALRKVLERDCESHNGQLVHRESGKRITAIIPVHLYGQTADLAEIRDALGGSNVAVIEDAAQSIGSEFEDGSRAGSSGDIGCFSFFPSKNLGAFGDAGMCTSNDEELAERLRILRLHGGKPKYYHAVVGGNFRLDAIQAAVLRVKFRYLDDWTAGRQANAAYYDEAFRAAGLGEKVVTPVRRTGRRHIYNQYVIRVDGRDELRTHLKDAGVATEIYYPVPLHLQKCFAYLGYEEGDFPVAEAAARETLALPVYPELGREDLDYVVEEVARFYG